MHKVAVLISTYNGEKFFEEQLDSILKQEAVDVDVYIRDDGSEEKFINVLKKINNDKVHIAYRENVGVGNSFMQLIYVVPEMYDFYALADQDDIWYKRKLIEAIECIKNNRCSLYGSNQQLVDLNGNIGSKRYDEETIVYTNSIGILQKNMIAGCTMVFPKTFLKVLREEQNRPSCELLKVRIHDVWIAMVASLYDGIFYDCRSFMLYRHHGSNLVGANTSGLKFEIKNKLRKLFDRNKRRGRSKLAKEIVDKFYDQIKNNKLILIAAKADTLLGKISLVKYNRFFREYSGETFILYLIKVLLGLF